MVIGLVLSSRFNSTLIMVNVNLTVLYGVGSVVSVFRGTDWGSKTLCHLPKDTQLLTGGRTPLETCKNNSLNYLGLL